MTCVICGDVEHKMPYAGATCSKECARIYRLLGELHGIEHVLRAMMLNLGGVR
jgi:hypothetical protein